MAAVAAVVIFAVAYLLIATEWVHRTAVALGGAGLMLLLHITTSDAAFFSHTPGTGELEVIGVDWNVIFLLLGMMVIVSVLRTTAAVGIGRHIGDRGQHPLRRRDEPGRR